MIDYSEARPLNMPRPAVTPEGAELPIRDASFPRPFHIGLEYSSPARGTWTIAHSTMLIPGLHQIYVCCACCLQGVVLSADELPGGSERFSMVTVTNENIIKGNLEEMMIEGVTDILRELPEVPRCVECFTSCIQHFLHIDLKVVYRTLRERFPEIDFIDGYMIPTLQRKYSPDVLGRRQLMRAIKPLPSRRQVNFVVNYFPVDPDSEIHTLLREGGFRAIDFAALESYEEYREMGASSANLYFLENARPAAEDMSRRLGQKAIYLPYSYDFVTIRENYRRLASELGIAPPEEGALEALEAEAEARADALRSLIQDVPVAIDFAATPRPLGLARFLLDRGFSVYAVYIDVIAASEEQDFFYLKEQYPALELRAASHFKRSLLPRTDAAEKGAVLAIGQKAAYYTGTDRFVNLIENGGLYGFRGIIRLLDLMEEAFRTPKDVRSIIQVKAWGCRG